MADHRDILREPNFIPVIPIIADSRRNQGALKFTSAEKSVKRRVFVEKKQDEAHKEMLKRDTNTAIGMKFKTLQGCLTYLLTWSNFEIIFLCTNN